MKKLEIFDPSRCCASKHDPILDQVAEDLRWVAEQGVEVKRYSFGEEPQVFTANTEVLREMGAAMERLPITMVDGNIIATGAHLSRAQLVQKLGLTPVNDGSSQTSAGVCCKSKNACC